MMRFPAIFSEGTKEQRLHNLVLVLIAAVTALNVVPDIIGLRDLSHSFFDFRTNYVAGLAVDRGINPFDLPMLKSLDANVVFAYVYPPYVAWLLRFMGRIPYAIAIAGNTIITALALLIIYFAQLRAFSLVHHRSLYLVAYTLGLGAITFGSFVTGNFALVIWN